MKSIICSFLSLFFINTNFSQSFQGQVTYRPNIDNFVDKIVTNSNTKNVAKTMFLEASKYAESLELSLSFDENYSFFTIAKLMPVDNMETGYKMAKIFAHKGDYYTDLKQGKQFLVRDFQGDKFNVLSEIEERNWTLTRESKKIAGFICYKATFDTETPKGAVEIVAWYTPEIPLSYGPNEFVGSLPGLILELHDTDVSYICSSITLNPQIKIVIAWPDGEGIMTQEEYKKAGDEIKKKLSRFN